MQICSSIEALQAARQELKGTLAVVLTMGNLHEGHLTLVRRAKELADHVAVSIYVNPMQFGPSEDLENYPRTLDDDISGLKDLDVDLLFTPNDQTIYPEGLDRHSKVVVPALGERLCGASRPGHFNGVTTVVTKLFNLIRPDVAVFGEKDYQQLAIIRKMVCDLSMPIRIEGVPTVRESSGLALSSRNGYLTDEQHQHAAMLYQHLQSIRDAILGGNRDYAQLIREHRKVLEENNFKIDYLEVCDQRTLEIATADTKRLVVLVAAWLGSPRLIDNIPIELT